MGAKWGGMLRNAQLVSTATPCSRTITRNAGFRGSADFERIVRAWMSIVKSGTKSATMALYGVSPTWNHWRIRTESCSAKSGNTRWRTPSVTPLTLGAPAGRMSLNLGAAGERPGFPRAGGVSPRRPCGAPGSGAPARALSGAAAVPPALESAVANAGAAAAGESPALAIAPRAAPHAIRPSASASRAPRFTSPLRGRSWRNPRSRS